eukprot:Partr_v1_DN28623_c1_g1_i2_m50530 putative Ctr9, Paf1 RNA polymerase II complex component, homolog (S. cerevisiae)
MIAAGLEDADYWRDRRHEAGKLHLLTAQAASLLAAARKSRGDQKSELLQKAVSVYNAIDLIGNQQPSTWLGKGVLSLAGEKFDQAAYQFKLVLDSSSTSSRNSVPALLGKAAILYRQQNYADALAVYQSLLRSHPRMKPDVRMGIGLCLWQLGHHSTAVYALDRVLERDPNNVDALVSAASMYYNLARKAKQTDETKANIMKTIKLAKAAQSLNKDHPVAAALLAEIVFQKGELEKSMKLLQNGLDSFGSSLSTAPSPARGLLSFMMGRIHHKNKNIVDAHKCYGTASKDLPQFHLALFGLGQTSFAKGDSKSAVKYFEASIPSAESFAENLIAFILSKDVKNRDRAVELFAKNAKLKNPDVDALVKYSELIEKTNPQEAIALYQRASALYTKMNQVSLHLLNNIGALYCTVGDRENAQKAFAAAHQLCTNFVQTSSGSVKRHHEDILTTVNYNLARLSELSGDLDKAIEIYDEILTSCPSYINASLRKALIAFEKGNVDECKEITKALIKAHPKNADILSVIANVELSSKDMRASRKAFEKILQVTQDTDVYALVGMGNDRLLAARSETKAAEKLNLHKAAVKCFEKAIRLQPGCHYAAVGLGIALLETGHPAEAKELFSVAREADVNHVSANVNLAHVLVELGQYKAASALYDSVNNRSADGADVQLVILSARAHYLSAKSTKHYDDIVECVKMCEKAYELQPDELSITYDLALAYQQFAQIVVDMDKGMRTLDILMLAQERLNLAEQHFGTLAKNEAPQDKLPYDKNMSAQREKHCNSVRNSITRLIAQQRANEDLQRENVQELLRSREIEAEKKRAEEKAVEAAKLAREQQLREERQVLLDKMVAEREEAKNRISVEVEMKPKKRSAKRKSAPTNDEEAEGDDVDGEVAPTKGSRKKALRRESADEPIEGESGASEPASPVATKKKLRRHSANTTQYKLSEALVESDSEDEGDAADEQPSSPSKRPKKMQISDEDSE